MLSNPVPFPSRRPLPLCSLVLIQGLLFVSLYHCHSVSIFVSPMPPISGKRAATSPLNSEFDKRPRMGLSDEELRGLNADLQERGPLPASILHPEAVEQKHIVWAFVEVATHASNVEPVWAKKDYCRKFVEKLSDDELRHVASIMIKARDDNEWSKLANYCVLHPSHRSTTLTAALCSLTSG